MNVVIKSVVRNEVNKFEKRQWSKVHEDYFGEDLNWENENHHYKAIDRKGNILGTITFDFEGGVIFINTIIVNSEFRGSGVGKKLIEYVEKWGAKNKAHKIYLFVHKGWKAIKFYRTLGFRRTTTLKNHFLNGDFYIYSKFLKKPKVKRTLVKKATKKSTLKTTKKTVKKAVAKKTIKKPVKKTKTTGKTK